MLEFILSILAVIRSFFRSRSDTALEILALRQQLAVFKRKRPRPPLRSLDRLFWTLVRRRWSRWADVLIIVKPDTVVGWHRSGFRLYWRWRSRPCGGGPQIATENSEPGATIGGRESGLGSAEDPWGAFEARLDSLGKKRGSILATDSAAP